MSITSSITTQAQAPRAAGILVGSIIATLLLWYVIPYGRTIAYPLVLLSTLVHEMGHGIAAIIVGASFEQFVMYSDGSGVAMWRGHVGAFGRAFISAGGLVGPAFCAGLGFYFGRTERGSRATLMIFGLGLIVSILMVVRNPFGILFVGLAAALSIFVSTKGQPWASQVLLLFLASQLALSVFSRGDYLFTDVAHTSQGPMPSDVAKISEALFLPYWFWGAVCGLISVAILFIGLRASLGFRSGGR
ncbi:MAG: M50 family metallopeptidase [Myxococcota bacterium]|nr:M50 family metallopeptidase [Myxococcota bacterium]